MVLGDSIVGLGAVLQSLLLRSVGDGPSELSCQSFQVELHRMGITSIIVSIRRH